MKRLLLIISTGFLAAYAGISSASSAAVVIPIEPNKTCSNVANNKLINQLSSNSSVGVIQSETVYATYTGVGGVSASFEVVDAADIPATVPIDFAILASSGAGALFVYPSGGTYQDSAMQILVGGIPQKISKITLCYGLGNTPPNPNAAFNTIVPACESLPEGTNLGSFLLDGVEISCPASGARSIVANYELGEPFYNQDGTYRACICNNNDQPLRECNPNLAYQAGVTDIDPNNPVGYSCVQPGFNGSKDNAEVTTHVELNNDPYYCTTSGGIRKCYAY